MKHDMNKSGFTLIELLVVIAIIAILGGLLLPAVNKVRQKGYETQARTEVKAIEAALRQYFAEYGRYPLNNTENDRSYRTGGTDNADLIRILRAIDEDPNAGHAINPRRIVFLDLDESSLDSDGNYLDPWKSQYIITLDTRFDNDLNFPASTGLDRLQGRSIAVFSLGPRSELGTVDEYIMSWNAN